MRMKCGIWAVLMMLTLTLSSLAFAGDMKGHAQVQTGEGEAQISDEELAREDVLMDIQDTVLDHILTVTDEHGFYEVDGKELSFLDFKQEFQQDGEQYGIDAVFVDLAAEEEVMVQFTLKAVEGYYIVEASRMGAVMPLSAEARALMLEYEQDIPDSDDDM